MCKKRKFSTFARCARFKDTFFYDKHLSWLGVSIFYRIKQKAPKLPIFCGVFFSISHTHWERKAVHKTNDFEWNASTKPDWASRGVRKTHCRHCKAHVRCPVMLVSVSTRSFEQHERKRKEKNCPSEVRGNVLPRYPTRRKRKNALEFCEKKKYFSFLGLSMEVWGLTQHQTN